MSFTISDFPNQVRPVELRGTGQFPVAIEAAPADSPLQGHFISGLTAHDFSDYPAHRFGLSPQKVAEQLRAIANAMEQGNALPMRVQLTSECLRAEYSRVGLILEYHARSES
jgi:hypothetical protein